MKGYGQYCPIARGAEIFAERWTPLIIRNLFLGCTTFSEILEGAPGISRTLLTQRLRNLERYGIIERRPNSTGRGSIYLLTDCGEGLVEVCFALGNWGARWLEVAPEHFDAHVVLWSMARLADRDVLPKARLVLRFELTELERKNRFWMVLDRTHSEVCLKHPGFDEDLVVITTSEWLTNWHMGRIPLAEAEDRGLITIEGERRLARLLPKLGTASPFAEIEPQRRAPEKAGAL